MRMMSWMRMTSWKGTAWEMASLIRFLMPFRTHCRMQLQLETMFPFVATLIVNAFLKAWTTFVLVTALD